MSDIPGMTATDAEYFKRYLALCDEAVERNSQSPEDCVEVFRLSLSQLNEEFLHQVSDKAVLRDRLIGESLMRDRGYWYSSSSC